MKTPVLLACLLTTGVVSAFARPNVVLLMTDDQGYPELSAHGNPVLQTPHLDQVHDAGVRLVDFHVAPMCTPTRGQLMTGRDAAANGAINVSSGRTLLRPELPTIANLLKEGGFRTGIFGKWHLGDNYPFRPQDRGFEESLWFPSSHINSTPDVWNNDYFDDTYWRNGKRTEYSGYCTDVFFQEAIAWMKERISADEPFFVYLPTNAPHSPYWVPKVDTEEMTKRVDAAIASGAIPEQPPFRKDSLAKYLAMIRNVDDNVGRLDTFLEETGVFDDTIFVFLTDNGSTMGEHYFPAGMRGKKTQLWEGGHRVPCFIRWPNGGLASGKDVAGLTQVQDLLPTLLSLTGVEPKNHVSFDGIDLSPVLKGENDVNPDRTLFINYSRMPIGFEYPAPDSPSIMTREMSGVLWKRWRLLEDRELYDLENDPRQQKNVIDEHPEVAEAMRERLNTWWEGVRDIANEPQRVIIGHEAENPMMLSACEWLDVFIDQQQQVRRADLKNGYWELYVAKEGEYEFELRRFPKESRLKMRDSAPEEAATDGVLQAGPALDIHQAKIMIGGVSRSKPVGEKDESAIFSLHIKEGPTRLYTWLIDERRQPLVGAYYVYVRKK